MTAPALANGSEGDLGDIQRRLWRRWETEPIQAVDGQCVHCGGLGVVTLDVPVGHAAFGHPFTCICKHRHDEAERMRRAEIERLRACGIPDEYKSYDLSYFVDAAAEGKELAIDLCRMMASGLLPALSGKIKEGLYLFGEFGTGKTGLAMSVLNARLAAGVGVHAMDFRSFLGIVQDTYTRRTDRKAIITRQDLIDFAATVPLLLIDDMGDKRRRNPYSDDQMDITTMLIQQRHAQRMPFIITSNLTPEEFINEELFFGGRIGQRVFERCHAVHVGGYCLRE